MESAAIKNDLIKTLKLIKAEEIPVLTEEITSYFIASDKSSQLNKPSVLTALNELQQERKVFSEDEFISFSESFKDKIKDRLDLEESTREKSKYTKNLFKFLENLPFVKFVAASGSSPFGRIAKNEKIKLIVVADKETRHLSEFCIKKYLQLNRAYKNFEVEKVFESDNLKWHRPDAESAIKLLNMIVVISKNKTYENFMATNNWIFDIFSNYPLEKVSWGFRVTKNIDIKTAPIFKTLNKFLTPKAL